jgi:glyoxylase-like metal-dependent hydrolase (beta-lactamase superfamily II)
MNSRIHHLNCASMAPIGSLGGRMLPKHIVVHCLLIEGPHGLTLVDTGFGTADIAAPKRLGTPFVKSMRPALKDSETALAQVEALCFHRKDLTNIVLTHLDVDHAGGLGDFPDARVHVYGEELQAARRPRTMIEKRRYIQAQWAHNPHWVIHEVEGQDWFGFGNVRAVDDDIRMVPLHGHTRGHCGVAVRRPEGGWLLHAGDSYFYTGEKETPASRMPGLTLFQKVTAMDEKSRAANQERLQELHAQNSAEVTIFSSHDKSEFDALAARLVE